MDINTSDEEILGYSKVLHGRSGLDWTLVANEEFVIIKDEDRELENAFTIGNSISRWRRKGVFNRRKDSGEKLPILVSEGDSWFQFPFLIKDTIDHLNKYYLIWSVGAAGNTVQNMLIDNKEYLKALRKFRSEVSAFLLSAAGNDIIGEDPHTGIAALQTLLNKFNGNTQDIEGHINKTALDSTLGFLRNTYTNTIETIRKEPGLEDLTIIIHGYDYVFPYPWHNDNRDPIYAKKNEWLGEPLDAQGILDKDLRQQILIRLIDELYTMLNSLTGGDSKTTGVWLVDCRDTLTDVTDWNDEIHGTSAGFSKIADKFRFVIEQAI